MPIDSLHPEYSTMVSEWQKCRAACDPKAVHDAGERYLPCLTSHKENPAAYKTYLARALWFGATGATVKGMSGAVMRVLPQVVVPDKMRPWLDNVTGTGQSFNLFAGEAVEEAIKTGRFGVMVDRDSAGQLKLALYQAESITNWLSDGKAAVVLKESIQEADAADPYAVGVVEQWRELVIKDGAYQVRLHRKEGEAAWSMQEVTPTKRGQFLDRIPFVFCSSDGDPVSVSKPPLIDLVNLNFSHYTLYADYRHGLFFGGHPTPVLVGVTRDDMEQNGPVSFGTSRPLYLPQGCDAKWMEFTGQGLGAMKEELDVLETRMAAMGAQMLMAPKASAEAADTVRMNRGAQASQLENIVYRVEAALTQALQIATEWEGLGTDGVRVTLNHELVDETLSPQDIQATMGLWQAGGIDKDTMLKRLQKGGVIEPGTDLEEVKRAIEKENEAPQFSRPTLTLPTKNDKAMA